MRDDLDLFEDQPAPNRNYPAILVRRRWYIIAPLLLCGLAGSLIAQVWPLLYRSDALILVEQQKVPEQYVTPNIITNLQDRLDAMTQQIESRTRLQSLIEQFHLYARERAKVTMDEVIDKMRKNITVALVQAPGRQSGVTGFRLTYLADNARVAQRITNELTSLFIDESMRQRTQQSASTTEFLQSQLDAAQKELAIQETRLREYKLQHIGELPEQEQGSLQLLSSAEAQLYSSEGALQRAEQQKTYLQAMRMEYLAITAPTVSADGTVVSPVDSVKSVALLQAENTIVGLEKDLSQLRAVYQPGWPRITQLEANLAFWQNKKKEIEAADAAKVAAGVKVSADATSMTNTRSGAMRLSMAELDSRLKSADIEIQNLQKDQTELKKRIQELQKRINMTPVREQQMAEITRTYENTRVQYQSLLQKKVQSELASNLDKRQQGEQFRILDPASLPDKPEGRLTILGMGWFLGLVLGIGLLVVREFAGQCVNDDIDVKSVTPFPVFRVPTIRTKREEARKRLDLGLECLAAAILVVVAILASARTYLMS